MLEIQNMLNYKINSAYKRTFLRSFFYVIGNYTILEGSKVAMYNGYITFN